MERPSQHTLCLKRERQQLRHEVGGEDKSPVLHKERQRTDEDDEYYKEEIRHS